MAVLFTVVYPDHETAEQAMNTAEALENAGYMNILDKALISKDENGKIDVDDEKHPVRRGGVVGGIVGGIVGTIFLLPVAGVAAGAAIGGLLGRGNKSGANEDFKAFSDTVEREMQNGDSAIVMVAESNTRDRVVHDLGQYGGKLYSYDMTDDQVAAVQKEMDRVAKQAEG